MAMSWDEDWEDETEDTEEELDYLLSEDEPESTDEEIWDRDIGARLENEWEPKEDDEDADFSATNDPVLCCRRIVTENPFDRRTPISEATLLEQISYLVKSYLCLKILWVYHCCMLFGLQNYTKKL